MRAWVFVPQLHSSCESNRALWREEVQMSMLRTIRMQTYLMRAAAEYARKNV